MSCSNHRANVDAKSLLASIIYKRTLDKSQQFPEHRREQRVDISIAICVVPINNGVHDLTNAFTAVTHDVAIRGLGIVAHSHLDAETVLICFVYQSELRILRATRRSQRHLGAGWFRIGLEETGTIKQDAYPELSRFVESILSGHTSTGIFGCAGS